jgi:hypothetical protein
MRTTLLFLMLAGCGGAEFTAIERIAEADASDAAELPDVVGVLDARAPDDGRAADAPDAGPEASPVDAGPETPDPCTPIATPSETCPGGRACVPSGGLVCADRGDPHAPGNEGCAQIPAPCACRESFDCACLLAAGTRGPWGAGPVGCVGEAGAPVLLY